MSYNPEFHLPKLVAVKSAGEAEQLAIDWQAWQADQSLSYAETIYYSNYFEQLATKFNLTEVFKENAII